jgi:uncharacterized protein YsxB (DUF464 family)
MNTNRLKLSIKGHATPAESDKHKEICAAASSLAQGLVYSVTSMTDEPEKNIQYRPDPGDLFFMVIPGNWAKQGILQRFQFYADGMELLAKSHPYSVTMIRDGKKILPEEDE